MSPEQRMQFSEDSATDVRYLYQLATCKRRQCKTDKALRIAEASTKMHRESLGFTPIITVAELGTMCTDCG